MRLNPRPHLVSSNEYVIVAFITILDAQATRSTNQDNIETNSLKDWYSKPIGLVNLPYSNEFDCL